MAEYVVHLVKLGDFSVEEGYRNQLTNTLRDLVSSVIRDGGNSGLSERFDSVRVAWGTTCPNVAAHEVLIYVVQGQLDSVVGPNFGHGFPEAHGFTAWNGNGTGSEIYLANRGAPLMARIAFHELMHNKLHWEGTRLHGSEGGGGLAQETVNESTQLTDANKTLMAGVLGNDRPQWTGGCDYYNDPLRGV
jgi:hypothetical protein